MNPMLYYIGDQHGNTLKMLAHLAQLGIINGYSEIENSIDTTYRNNEVAAFGQLLQQLEFNQEAINSLSIIWLGDLIAERGMNDAMTYRLLGLMHEKGVDFKITISNHDAIALRNLEKKEGRWLPKKPTDDIKEEKYKSRISFAEYYHREASPAERQQVSEDIGVYLEHLILCSLEDDFEDPTRKFLAMHARPTIFTLNMMLVIVSELESAGKIKPGIHDLYNFHDVVNILNSYFKKRLSTLELFNDRRFKNYCKNLLLNNDQLYNLDEDDLFIKLLADMVWNRLGRQWFTEDNKKSFTGYRLIYPEISGKLTLVHGHEGGSYTVKIHSCGTKEVGLDNRVGFSVESSVDDSTSLLLERICIQTSRPFTGNFLTTKETSGGDEAKKSVERKLRNFLSGLKDLASNNKLINEHIAMISHPSFHLERLNQPNFRKCFAAGYHYLNINNKKWEKKQGCMETRRFLDNLCKITTSSSDYQLLIQQWLVGDDGQAPSGTWGTSRLTIALKYGIISEKPKQKPFFWQVQERTNGIRQSICTKQSAVRLFVGVT